MILKKRFLKHTILYSFFEGGQALHFNKCEGPLRPFTQRKPVPSLFGTGLVDLKKKIKV